MSKTGNQQALADHEEFLSELWAQQALEFFTKGVGMVEAATVAREGGWATSDRNRRARALLEHVLSHRVHPHDRARLEAEGAKVDETLAKDEQEIPLKDALRDAMNAGDQEEKTEPQPEGDKPNGG